MEFDQVLKTTESNHNGQFQYFLENLIRVSEYNILS